jgi:hypothetical protein
MQDGYIGFDYDQVVHLERMYPELMGYDEPTETQVQYEEDCE